MRLRKDPHASEKLLKFSFVATKFPQKVAKKSVLEIGTGKGEMITELATKNPDISYFGFEKEPTVLLKAARKVECIGLKNVTLVVGDATEIETFFDGRFAEIWITFPDPWPKNRHYKRRLTYVDFLSKYKPLLRVGGRLRFKTDNDKLFAFSLEQMQLTGAKIIFQTTDLAAAEVADNERTGYEKKWMAAGKNINYLEASFE